MKKLSSIANDLDRFFSSIEEESSVKIEYTCNRSEPGNRFGDGFSILNVNGFNDHHAYSNHLSSCFADLLHTVISHSLLLKNGQNLLFLDAAIQRLRKLKCVISFRHNRHWNSGPGFWVFSAPELCCNENTVLPRYYHNAILCKTSRFAQSWNIQIKIAINKLEICQTCQEMNKPETDPDPQPEAENKLQINSSVPVTACVLRAFAECELIGSGNRADICRFISAGCKTKNQPLISFKSFKNHFNNPEIAAIETAIIQLYNMIAILKSLKEK